MLYIISSEHKRREAMQAVAQCTSAKVMQVEIKEYKKNRSTSQNRLYWMWLNVIGDFNGNTADELHEEMKVRFLGVQHIEVAGTHLIIPKSTAKLNTTEFTKFLEAIEALAMELGVALPIPDDYDTAMGIKRAA